MMSLIKTLDDTLRSLKKKGISLNDPVSEYALSVFKDSELKQLVGETEKLVCLRHLRDLDRLGDENFPYVFNYFVAESGIIKFVHKYCKFTDGKLVGKPVRLEPHQYFMFGSLFGWIHKETGYRRFNQAYIQKARKNGKTLEISWIANYMLLADGYWGSQVYTAANAKDQAKLCWKDCAKTIRMSKPLKKRVKIKESTNEINFNKKFSYLKALSSETKNLDGFNPHCGVIDEYHAHRNNQIYKLLDDGTVQQDESLVFIITTAGFNLDGPCYSEYLYCKEILNGVKVNDKRFIFISEMDKKDKDDLENPKNWLKANPLFRYLKDGVEKLAQKVREGLDNQEHYRNMMTKTLNIWLDSKDNGYMELEKWKECGISKEELFDIIKGKECYCGVDLSQKHDLVGVTFEFPLGGNLYAVVSRGFIPADRVRQKEKIDGVPYSHWIDLGYLIPCEGLTIRNQQVEDFIQSFPKEHDFTVREVDYDSYCANQLAQNLQAKGYVTVEIRQGMKTLSEPTKDFRNQAYDKNILHENNPVYNWNVYNAVEKMDHNGNIMLDKSDRSKKIDGLASTMNSHTRAMTHDFNEKEFDAANYTNEEYLSVLLGD